MNSPDFLIVGAARAGTTALYRMLEQHPQIYLPAIKEPCFYAFAEKKPEYKNGKFTFAVTSKDDYEQLFNKAGSHQLKGEASTPYLYLHKETIQNIQRLHPSPATVKIIIILRNPVDRAYSNYHWRVRDGRESLTFEEALAAEKDRMLKGFSFDYFYKDRGFYFDAVNAYLTSFPNVRIILYDDFIASPSEVMKDLCMYLGIAADFSFKIQNKINASYSSRWPWLSRLITTESSIKFKLWYRLPANFRDNLRRYVMRITASGNKNSRMLAETRKRLMQEFKSDVEQLAVLINRDLSNWFKI